MMILHSKPFVIIIFRFDLTPNPFLLSDLRSSIREKKNLRHAPPEDLPMMQPFELCRHVKANGLRCGSPAIRGENWCFFHERLLTRHRNIRAIPSKTPKLNLQLPPLEDRESIQIALSLVTDAILTGVLAEKTCRHPAPRHLHRLAQRHRNRESTVPRQQRCPVLYAHSGRPRPGPPQNERRLRAPTQTPAACPARRPLTREPDPPASPIDIPCASPSFQKHYTESLFVAKHTVAEGDHVL